MKKEEFEKMIDKVLDAGIEITLFKSEGKTIYDLNTGMKSHLHLSFKDDVCNFYGRYGVEGVIEDFDNLLQEVANCDHGKGFANQSWSKLVKM